MKHFPWMPLRYKQGIFQARNVKLCAVKLDLSYLGSFFFWNQNGHQKYEDGRYACRIYINMEWIGIMVGELKKM